MLPVPTQAFAGTHPPTPRDLCKGPQGQVDRLDSRFKSEGPQGHEVRTGKGSLPLFSSTLPFPTQTLLSPCPPSSGSLSEGPKGHSDRPLCHVEMKGPQGHKAGNGTESSSAIALTMLPVPTPALIPSHCTPRGSQNEANTMWQIEWPSGQRKMQGPQGPKAGIGTGSSSVEALSMLPVPTSASNPSLPAPFGPKDSSGPGGHTDHCTNEGPKGHHTSFQSGNEGTKCPKARTGTENHGWPDLPTRFPVPTLASNCSLPQPSLSGNGDQTELQGPQGQDARKGTESIGCLPTMLPVPSLARVADLFGEDDHWALPIDQEAMEEPITRSSTGHEGPKGHMGKVESARQPGSLDSTQDLAGSTSPKVEGDGTETTRQRRTRLRASKKAKEEAAKAAAALADAARLASLRPKPILPLKAYVEVIGNRDIHLSHDVRFLNGIYACWNCGSWATSVPRGLHDQCKPPTQAGRDVLVRAKQGLTPKTCVEWPVSPSP